MTVGELAVLAVCMVLCRRTRHAPAFCNDAHCLGHLALSESLWAVFYLLTASSSPYCIICLVHLLRALTTAILFLALIVQPKVSHKLTLDKTVLQTLCITPRNIGYYITSSFFYAYYIVG